MTHSRLLLTALAFGAFAAPVPAQQATVSAAASLAWVGCWEPMDALPGSGLTCIVPDADLNSLRLLEVAGGQARQVSTLHLDGSRQPVTADGCTGWERARLSADGNRILLDAEVSCAGLPAQTRSGAFLITPRGDWLHVQGSGFAAVANARVRLFRETSNLVSLPLDVRQDLGRVLGMAEATRAEVAARKLSAADLRELASLEVATPVIDVIVAAGFPGSFVLDPSGSADVSAAPRDERTSGIANSRVALYPTYYGFGYPSLGWYDSRASMCGMNMFGMYDYSYCARTSQWSRYGYGGFYGYGFGSGWLPGYGNGGGVVVVVRPSEPLAPRASGGRIVNGQGYTQGSGGSSTTGSTAQPRTRATPSSSQGSSSSGSSGSSGGSVSAGSGSGSSSNARTAKPRDP